MNLTKQYYSILTLTIAAALSGCAGSSQPATSTPEPAQSQAEAAAPSFEEQADRGAKLYGSYCASCHGDGGEGGKGPALVGTTALPLEPAASAQHRKVQFGTALDVFVWVKEFMPANAPGSLTDDEYVAILAFDLKANGVTLDEPLTGKVAAELKLH